MLRISFKRAHCVERLCVGQSVSKDDDMRYRDPGTGAQWWAQAAAYAAYLTNDNGQISIYQTLYTFTQENIPHGKYEMKPSLVIRTSNQLQKTKRIQTKAKGRMTRRNDHCLEKGFKIYLWW